jgi:hypothetical protein
MDELHLDQRTVRRLEAAVESSDPLATADQVTCTERRWFDGLDPATAWALVWIEVTPKHPGLDDLIGLTTRFGYRHGRLLFGGTDHPCFSDPATADVLAAMVLELASQLAPSPAFRRLPDQIATCHHHLAERAGQVVAREWLPIPADRLVPVLLLTLDLGFAVSVVEEHLARRHWLITTSTG